jgi:hypothetical protein
MFYMSINTHLSSYLAHFFLGWKMVHTEVVPKHTFYVKKLTPPQKKKIVPFMR